MNKNVLVRQLNIKRWIKYKRKTSDLYNDDKNMYIGVYICVCCVKGKIYPVFSPRILIQQLLHIREYGVYNIVTEEKYSNKV